MKIILLILLLSGASMQKTFASSWWEMTPTEVREMITQRVMAIEAPTPQVMSTEDRCVKKEGRETPVRIYLPNNNQCLPIVLLIHGGAWVAGNLDTHDNLARYLCSEAEVMVVSVDYVNAPEGKFPLQLLQCYDVLHWIRESAGALSVDVSKLIVAGDSAGGNIAAALCLMARDLDGPKIAMQVLINPALDLRCNGTLERQNDSLDTLRWQAIQYVTNADEANNPYVSPLAAEDLRALPRAVILLAEYDDLRESGQKYADRLKDAGVDTFVYCQKGVGHLAGHGARASLQARESLDVVVDAIFKLF